MGANDHMTGGHMDLHLTESFRRLGVPWKDRVIRQTDLDKLSREAAAEWILDNPIRYVSFMPYKQLLLWEKDTDGFWSYKSSYPGLQTLFFGFQILNQAFYLIVLILALYAAICALRALVSRSLVIARLGLLFCMPLFVSLLAAVFTGQTRYHFPAMPFLLITASWAIFQTSLVAKVMSLGMVLRTTGGQKSDDEQSQVDPQNRGRRKETSRRSS